MDSSDSDSEPSFIKKTLTIPCMRKSLLYGIGGGLGVGLTYFLFTSNVRRATNWGAGGFLLFLYGTWGVCRYKLAKDRYVAYQWQKAQQSKGENIQLVDPKDV